MKIEKRKMEVATADPKIIDKLYRKYLSLHNCDCEELNLINKNLIFELKENIRFEERDVELFLPESSKEIKKKNNPEFIKEILKVFVDKNYRIHATSSADKILEKGLLLRSEIADLDHTSLIFNNLTDNEILYKLYNEMYRFQTQIIVMDADNCDLIEYNGKYLLPTERIKLYIDLEKQEIVKNPKFIDIGRSEDRIIDRENKEIEIPESDNIYENQINIFERVLKVDSITEIENTNEEIYSFINGILINIERGKICLTKDTFNRLVYYIAQIDNDIHKSLKVIKIKEEKNQRILEEKNKNENILNSGLNMDSTEDLF